MALQRPIPPPRRSKAGSKTVSADVENLIEKSSEFGSTGFQNNEIRSTINEISSSASPSPAIVNREEKENCKLASSTECYDSKTIPQFRQRFKPPPSAARTSNLIWFQSGVPAEFAVKTASNSLDQANNRDSPLAIAFSALDESDRLPDPVSVAPIVPRVPSLYPKLPPSPVFPPNENASDQDPTASKPTAVVTRTSNGPTAESPDKISLSSTASKSSFREDGRSPFGDVGLDDEAERKLLQSVNGCTLALQQPSIDGSVSSTSEIGIGTLSDAQSTSDVVFGDSLIASVPESNDRLKLSPIGTNVCNVGWLNKLGAKKKDTVRRWCVLRNGNFEVFVDDTSDTAVESIQCKSVEMAFILSSTEMASYDTDVSYAFTISFINDSRKVDQWTFSAELQEDVVVWMALLTKCIVQSEAADLCEAVDRAGPLYLKKGTTADWEPGWFVMRGKVLLYAAEGDACCYEVDIRKVIRIRTITDANDCCPSIQSQVPFSFVVSTEGSALYAQSRESATSRIWKNAIESKLLERTGLISEQRLTTDDIPVIVEKCISFVAVYGLSVEGIYRHSGTMTKVKTLLELFVKDPHAVHLRADEYAVHDVTSVLKKYFRQLDDSLMTSLLRPRFIEKSGLAEHGSRVMAYKRLLGDLPLINYNTMRKLLRHLKMVTNHADKNMMTTQNLAAIFGPTLFYVDKELVEEGSSSYVSASQAINIIAEMLLNYDELFQVDSTELQKELKIEEALQRIENHNLIKKPGQFLLSIHVLEKDANVFNMPADKVTASEVCQFAVAHKKLDRVASQLGLFEVVCNGQLERLLNADESLLDVISRWSSWSLDERAANYLIVKPDYFKERVESMTTSSLLTSCDVQLSELKSFRKCTFQCSKGEILMYKNSKGTKPLQSWAAEKCLWYFGCESKRQPPTAFCLAFLEKDSIVRRTKNAPFFGRCVCFNDESSLYKWLITVTLSNTPLRAHF